MPAETFDNHWFHDKRRKLLEHWDPPGSTVRDLRAVRAISRGSAAVGDDKRVKTTEQMLARLPNRQEAAVRGHMQMYRSCLEATAFVPSDELVHAAVQIEWLWYTTPFKKFYRDHLAHVMKVALIALELWRNKQGPLAQDGAPLIERTAASLASGELGCEALRQTARRCGNTREAMEDPAFWTAAVLEATRIAGLLHDLAYPSIMAGKYVNPTASIADPMAMFTLGRNEAAARVLDRFGDRLIAAPFCSYKLPEPELTGPGRDVFAEFVLTSHSLQAGARILQFGAEADRRWRLTPFEAFVIEWAALAASLHDYDKAFELYLKHRGNGELSGLKEWFADKDRTDGIRPNYQRDPVSYIVALADQLQDFGRVNYDMSQAGDSAEFKLRYPVASVTLDVEASTAKITFKFDDDATDIEKCKIREHKLGTGDEQAAAHKQGAARMIFGADGAESWFDHAGLLEEVSVQVVSSADVTSGAQA